MKKTICEWRNGISQWECTKSKYDNVDIEIYMRKQPTLTLQAPLKITKREQKAHWLKNDLCVPFLNSFLTLRPWGCIVKSCLCQCPSRFPKYFSVLTLTFSTSVTFKLCSPHCFSMKCLAKVQVFRLLFIWRLWLLQRV